LEKEEIYSKLKSLVQKFEANKYHYLSKNYLEEEVKIDFINPLFETLGWDIRNTKALSPYEREVVVEKGETIGHPDYNFRIDGQTRFFIEAKAPHEPLHKVNHVLQAKSYAWNTKNVFIVLLTDFEEFRLFDATIKPDAKNPDQGLIFELSYNQYLDNIDKLMLLSKEEVEKGSLERLILKDLKSKKLRIPVDKAFLEDLSQWREELAKDIYKRNIKELEDRTDEKRVKIQVKILNEAVQKILNRLIFIRIAEDRKIIEPKSLLDEVEWWKAGGKRRDLHRRLTDRFIGWNQDFNGEILKIGPCDVLAIDSHLLAKTIEGLYFPTCPYRFDVIGVELLGSIYERYLGKTIRVTPKRVKIEEKPEVRKAGGVYYTPQYIVDYIVKNTVEKVIKKKTPKQIEKIKILDPACGSGSFLLAAFHTLIDYHFHYYEKHPEESGQGILFPDIIVDYDGTRRLSIEKKAQILKNNIFGVDIDPQAAEIAMMSLYLKCLEGERDLPRKKELLPSLAKNIRCGNSLISYDIFDQLTLFEEEEKERINPFDWHSKSTGFGEIMERGGFDCIIGNPPYIRVDLLDRKQKEYFKKNFLFSIGKYDLYYLFIEKSIELLKRGGLFGFIVPNKICSSESGKYLRKEIIEKSKDVFINSVSHLRIFGKAANYPILFFVCKNQNNKTCRLKLSISKNKKDLEKDRINLNINYKTLQQLPKSIFPINTNQKSLEIYFKIKKKYMLLKDILDISEGFRIPTKLERDQGDEHIVKQYQFSRYSPVKKGSFILKADRRKVISDKSIRFINSLKDKIIFSEDALKIEATLEKNKSLCQGGVYFASLNEDFYTYNLNYLLALLGSKLLTFVYKTLFSGMHMGGGYLRFRTRFLNQLPIRKIDFNNPKETIMYAEIVELADDMLELNEKKSILPLSSKKEKIEREIKITDEKIDELVYKLYGITDEERKIIEEKNNDY
jgi:hypothetical protein